MIPYIIIYFLIGISVLIHCIVSNYDEIKTSTNYAPNPSFQFWFSIIIMCILIPVGWPLVIFSYVTND